MEKRSYPEFENTVITYHCPDSDYHGEKALVVGCDYYLGMTLVSAANPDVFMACVHGPMSPAKQWLYKKYPHMHEQWDSVFQAVLNDLKMGVYDADKIYRLGDAEPDKIDLGSYKGPTAASCPFGQ